MFPVFFEGDHGGGWEVGLIGLANVFNHKVLHISVTFENALRKYVNNSEKNKKNEDSDGNYVQWRKVVRLLIFILVRSYYIW